MNGKYSICKGGCENKYLTCTNKSQSSLTSVPENWTGAKMKKLFYDLFLDTAHQTQLLGLILYLGCISTLAVV